MSSWKLDSVFFEDFGVYVSRSSGVLNIPKIAVSGHDWLDENGKEYQEEPVKYQDREIALTCWIFAEATGPLSGYSIFIQKVTAFYAALMEEGLHVLSTPYGDVPNCHIQNGIDLIRETNYVLTQQVGTFTLRMTVRGDSQYKVYPVYHSSGAPIVDYLLTENMVVNRSLQGESSASCSVERNSPLNVDMYAYILINTNGINPEPYYFMSRPPVTKQSTNKFSYNLKLEHGSILLVKSRLKFDGINTFESDFEIFADLDTLVDLICLSADRFIPNKFRKGTIEPTIRKNHIFKGEDCLSALKRLSAEYELEYDIRYTLSGGVHYQIDILPQIANTKNITLEYGKGKGLYELTREQANLDKLATVFWIYGANKNLKPDYRGGKRRLEFDGNPLRKNENLYMSIEKDFFFDDIYPERTATISGYTQILKVPEGDPGYLAYEEIKEEFPGGMYLIEDDTVFNINDFLLGGLTAKIRMKSGAMAGYEFEIIRYDHPGKIFITPYKEKDGYMVPNDTLKPESGDQYTLVDIDQPESYVEEAELRLKTKGEQVRDMYCTPEYPYKATVDPKFLQSITDRFDPGDRITVKDDDLEIEQLYRISQFSYNDYTGVYDLTLSENRIIRNIEGLKVAVAEIKKLQQATNAQTVETIRKDQETATELRNRMFEPADDLQALDRTVRDESIDPRMLSYDAGVPMWLVKGVIIEPSYEGDENKLRITNGEIFITNDPAQTKNRYDIAKDRANYNPNRVWSIESYTFDLDTGHEYFLFAKLPLATGETTGTLELSEEFVQVKRYIEDGYIYYPVAFINTAASPRVVSALWGNVRTVNGTMINEMIDPRLLTGGRPLYLHQQDSDITNYKKLLFDEPDEAFQEYDCFTDFYEGEKLLKEFSTDPGFTSVIRSGAWIFSIWAKASNNDDSSDLLVYVLKRDGDGVETELFNFEVPVNAIVPTCYQKVVMHTQEGITATDRIVVRFKHRCVSALGKTLYVYCEGDTDGEWWWSNVRIPVDSQGGTDTDEKVKYNEDDPEAGYLEDKIIAGENIVVEEGTGADENKVKISAVIPSFNGQTFDITGGFHYNWWAAADARNMAPVGWKVPSESDLIALRQYLDDSGTYENNVSGEKMKETGTTYWNDPNVATNESLFYARGSGSRVESGFTGLKQSWKIWSTDERDGTTAYVGSLANNEATFYVEGWYSSKYYGTSVRWLCESSDDPGFVIGNNGVKYPTVKIGLQVWTACNVVETKYRNGDLISGPIFSNSAWAALTTGAYCIYNDDLTNAYGNATIIHNELSGIQGGNETERYHLSKDQYDRQQPDWEQEDDTKADYIWNKPDIVDQVQSDWNQTDDQAVDYIKNKPTIPDDYGYWVLRIGTLLQANVVYGYFYNWWAATDSRNIAPAGWHVPSRAEAEQLATFLGGGWVAGGKLKETGLTYWDSPNTEATNETGFKARGSGYRYSDFSVLKRYFKAWTSTNDVNVAYVISIVYNYGAFMPSLELGAGGEPFYTGVPIRLLKDDSSDTGIMTGNDGKVYPTVKIGNQVWMAVNLMETKYRNGDTISGPTYTNSAWAALTTEAYCIYNDDEANAGDPEEVPNDLKVYSHDIVEFAGDGVDITIEEISGTQKKVTIKL